METRLRRHHKASLPFSVHAVTLVVILPLGWSLRTYLVRFLLLLFEAGFFFLFGLMVRIDLLINWCSDLRMIQSLPQTSIVFIVPAECPEGCTVLGL